MASVFARFSRSVLWKLSALFVFVFFVTGAIQTYFSVRGWRKLVEVVEQQANWNIAPEFALRIQPFVKDRVDEEELGRLLFNLTVFNPKLELLLVRGDGSLRAVIPFHHDPVREAIDLAPVKRALEIENPEFPLTVDDPFSERGKKIFSAAPLIIEGNDGYLVVTLISDTAEFFVRKAGQIYVLTTVLFGLLVSYACSLIIGFLLSSHLRKRFREMKQAIAAFESGDYSKRATDLSKDEIGELSQSFNRMASTIVGHVEELKRKDQLRRELVANITHDLRGPVTSIIGYTDSLLEASQTEQTRNDYLSIIQENALRQQRMIEDLFQLSRLEANESEPRKELSSLPYIVKSVVEGLRPAAEKKQQALVAALPDKLQPVYVDPAMIQRVLQNLLINSIRYTPPGGRIEIAATERDDAVCCSVSDTGIGIPPEEVPHVFESFYRANQHRPENPGGTGLGLAIVKKLLALHNSEPSIESRVNEGTRITFALQVSEPSPAERGDSRVDR